MKYGFRYQISYKYGFAGDRDMIDAECCSVVVRNCRGIPRDMQPFVREIHDLRTPEHKRRTGLAKKMMSNLCLEADEGQISLLLLVNEDKKATLCKFYGIFGFEIAQDDDKACVMIRKPLETSKECLRKTS